MSVFILKDNQGRVVIAQGEIRDDKVTLWAKNPDHTLTRVDEAVIAVSDRDDLLDLVPDREWCAKHFTDAGFSGTTGLFCPQFGYHSLIQIQTSSGYFGANMWGGGARTQEFTVNYVKVTKEIFDKVREIQSEVNTYDWLTGPDMHMISWDRNRRDDGNVTIPPQVALEMIGVGETVTGESLPKACAKGETRTRLWLGDSVEIMVRKETVIGRITGLGKKVSILRADSKKGTYAYSGVKRIEGGVCWDEEAVKELDSTLAANFKYVLGQAHRIYKAAITVRDSVKFPAFPGPDEDSRYEISRTDEPTCECPLCGWPMADFHENGEFQCCFCRVRGIVAHKDSDTVTLLMLRQPAKNKFAIREAKCCGNCGLFNFEYGRQGKRSTGYCQATNQCVQAHSTCVNADGTEGYWFPRTPTEYSKQITQHMTNLGYGVKDTRNTKRQDIRDTIYRKEDHEEEKKRAERARLVYAAAYAKFLSDLADLASKRRHLSDEFTEEQKDGVRKHYQQVLSDGC